MRRSSVASQTPEEGRTSDIRPDLPANVQGWTLEQFRDYYRTLNHRLGLFQLLVSALGLDDALTQQSWEKLVLAAMGREDG